MGRLFRTALRVIPGLLKKGAKYGAEGVGVGAGLNLFE